MNMTDSTGTTVFSVNGKAQIDLLVSESYFNLGTWNVAGIAEEDFDLF